ncbi:MAG: carbohydrate ABC transporter substrate-binding protein [Clostridia bacterium]|nr:carbohydrate ABC transporter substrate-binding protein [Clostridia bacterium]
MKKSKKAIALVLSTMLTFGAVSGLAACGGGGVKVDESTIVVKVRRAGFGTDWLYELKGKFEAAYAEQGYKVKIMTPDNSIKDDVMVKELALKYNKTKVDLYISSGATPNQVGELGDYGVLVEDLEESVYNKTAISYDGTEETKTVREKLGEDVLPYMTDANGKIYAYNWAQASAGLVVNTRKLAAYGLDMPKTTNEMFDCFDKIYCGYNDIPNSIESGTYPITYVSGGNGYGVCFLYNLMAQYGIDDWNTFWTFQTKNEAGETVKLSDAECQELFDDPMLYEMMKVAYKTFDLTIAAPGSGSQGVDQAQAKIMGDVDGAVFMFNGDWMLNEVKLNYEDELDEIDFIKFPVLSAVGTKVFGAGTSYNFDDAKCEELLSYMIDLVDENKDIDDIVAAVKAEKNVDVTADDVKEIAASRGVTYARGPEHVAYVTKGTPKMDIVSLFLRMMASDDFGETFSRTANGTSPYCAKENTTSAYDFVKNASKIPANQYYSQVSTFGGLKGYRGQIGGSLLSMFTTKWHIPDYVTSESTASIYTTTGTRNGNTDSVYADAAAKFLADEKANVISNWANYLATAGL